MKDKLASFFGLERPDDVVLKLMLVFSIIGTSFTVITTLSTTFYVVFVAQTIGQGSLIDGMALVSILLVIEMTTQVLFDYPTGIIGDWIGQRYVLASSFFTYAIAYFMVSFITYTTSFSYLALVYALEGFASSQNSGALSSWFDTNYRAIATDDLNRKRYGVFKGRYSMLIWLANTVAVFPGVIIAILITKQFVFQLESFLLIGLAFLALLLVRDPQKLRKDSGEPLHTESYFGLLKQGVQCLLDNPFLLYLIIGLMIVNSELSIWGELILFPLYYTYLITDFAVASLRTVIKTPYVVFAERSGVWAKRFEPRKWIPRFSLIATR
jgi:MFS family permease